MNSCQPNYRINTSLNTNKINQILRVKIKQKYYNFAPINPCTKQEIQEYAVSNYYSLCLLCCRFKHVYRRIGKQRTGLRLVGVSPELSSNRM